jgi:phage baseplate assembly protein W
MGRYVMANEVAVTLPFMIDYSGRVSFTKDQKVMWADRVKSVIGTAVRERVMRPTFGTLIPYALFDSENDAIREVEVEVHKAFNAQLSSLSLDNVNAVIDTYTNTITVNVSYSLPNNIKVTTSLGVISLAGSNPPYEEIL